jgi:hypothetical protein
LKLACDERAIASGGRQRARFGALLPMLALVATSCRSPTEIVLKVHTNVACTDSGEWRGVAVYVGEPGAALEKKWPTLVTTQCDADGYVGSLIVAPSGDKGERVGLRVVAGLSRDPETCEEAGYAGCIVARRALRFSPHDALELNVELLTDCKSRACDPNHTCVSGSCVDDDFVDPPTVPAGAPDEPGVRCGDDGLRCATTGDVCCLTVDESQGTTHGQCKPSKDCENIVLNCDDATDCAAVGGADPSSVECFLQYDYDAGLEATDANASFEPTAVSLSQCLPITGQLGHPRLTLCQEKRPCKDMFACRPSRGVGDRNLLPGYFWCEFF